MDVGRRCHCHGVAPTNVRSLVAHDAQHEIEWRGAARQRRFPRFGCSLVCCALFTAGAGSRAASRHVSRSSKSGIQFALRLETLISIQTVVPTCGMLFKMPERRANVNGPNSTSSKAIELKKQGFGVAAAKDAAKQPPRRQAA
jgi:hypothetical protein